MKPAQTDVPKAGAACALRPLFEHLGIDLRFLCGPSRLRLLSVIEQGEPSADVTIQTTTYLNVVLRTDWEFRAHNDEKEQKVELPNGDEYQWR